MPLPERDYFSLPDAAAAIGCTVNDLVHWAANRKTRLGVLFHIDEFLAERYHWMDGEKSARKIREFHGFAYVNQFYFAHLERRGEFVFNAVEMLDGSNVFIVPPDVEVRSIDGIFMHRAEMEVLQGSKRIGTDSPLPTSRAHVSDKLAKMNQAAVKFWGNADRNDRGTHPDNATVTAWLVQQNFSQTLADKAATIIRPEWAPSGRKPDE